MKLDLLDIIGAVVVIRYVFNTFLTQKYFLFRLFRINMSYTNVLLIIIH